MESNEKEVKEITVEEAILMELKDLNLTQNAMYEKIRFIKGVHNLILVLIILSLVAGALISLANILL